MMQLSRQAVFDHALCPFNAVAVEENIMAIPLVIAQLAP
jgi:hypothetical protein